MSFSQFPLAAPASIDLIEKAIRDLESPLLEFVGMTETGHFPSPNVLYFKAHDEPVDLQPIRLEQIPSTASQDQATARLDKLIDQGVAPLSSFFDVNLAKGEVTVIAYRSKQDLPPTVQPDGEGFVTTRATVFGLNMNGTYDDEDNGMGSPILGSINTRNPLLIGAAIPIRVLRQKFGSLKAAKGAKLTVIHTANNRQITADLVDLGPGEGQVAKGIALDLTLGAQRALNGDGLIPVRYKIL